MRSKQLLQEDLNELYTGKQISSHYVYAQLFTYLYCIMMFSTGMPLLYLFGAIFYTIFYWFYKCMLLKDYTRTNKINEELPITTTSYVTVAVYLHVMIGGYMITNSSILP